MSNFILVDGTSLNVLFLVMCKYCNFDDEIEPWYEFCL